MCCGVGLSLSQAILSKGEKENEKEKGRKEGEDLERKEKIYVYMCVYYKERYVELIDFPSLIPNVFQEI